MKKLSEITHIPIKIISPEKSLELTFNEVEKPETGTYSYYKPTTEKLFCEKIFNQKKIIKIIKKKSNETPIKNGENVFNLRGGIV